MEENKVLNGSCVWFSKGYGFVKSDEDGKDYFVHYSDIQLDAYKTLKKGQKVKFSLGLNIRGQVKAVNVVPLKD